MATNHQRASRVGMRPVQTTGQTLRAHGYFKKRLQRALHDEAG
jgi:hypothetical protein